MLKTNEEIRKERIRELYKKYFEKYNTVVGKVIGCNSYGCYVREDETGEVVFYFGNGNKGDQVQLSVKRVDFDRERVTCELDAVLEYGEMSA